MSHDLHAPPLSGPSERIAAQSNGIPAREWHPSWHARYLLLGVTTVYFLAMVDRGIFAILSQAIKRDLQLNDFQLGILSGIAFALLYGGLTIPIARLAERFNRVTLIASVLALWSTASALSGAATTFALMALARAGVGAGEAGCHPCAQSLIADRYPPNRRATATSIYSLAIPLGTMAGLTGGAYLAQNIDWRWAFVAVGVPGVIVALVMRLTVAEPKRGQYDPGSTRALPSYSAVLRHLSTRRTFIHLMIGWILTAAAWSSMGQFMAPYLLRSAFGLDLEQIGWILGLLAGPAALIGTLAGGFLSDRLAKKDVRFYMWVPSVALLITSIAFVLGLIQTRLILFIIFFAIGNICMLVYTGPSWGTLHNLVPAQMRASAVATLSVIVAVVGAGFGPMVTGEVSDIAARYISRDDFVKHCVHPALSNSVACRSASYGGLKYALILTVLLFAWASIHYYIAARSIRKDLVSWPGARP
ncbi:MAG TPA: MFS transporter [Rhodanobacteraceae bacterium]